MTEADGSKSERLLRREQAAKYVVETYNLPCSPKTLAKLACVCSEGPPFRLAGRFPLYPVSGLDAWAQRLRERSSRAECDCFVYFISGAKVRAPAAAQALLQRLTLAA